MNEWLISIIIAIGIVCFTAFLCRVVRGCSNDEMWAWIVADILLITLVLVLPLTFLVHAYLLANGYFAV